MINLNKIDSRLKYLAIVFISVYILVNTFYNDYFYQPLNPVNYTFNTTNVDPANTWSAFSALGNSTFFMHSGEINPVKVNFEFLSTVFTKFDFGVKTKLGSLKCQISKNDKTPVDFVIDSSHKFTDKFFFTSGDHLVFSYDKNGVTTEDQSEMKIYKYDFTNFWFLLFISIIITYLILNRFYYILTLTAGLGIIFLLIESYNYNSLTNQKFNAVAFYFTFITAISILFYQLLAKYDKYYISVIANIILFCSFFTYLSALLIQWYVTETPLTNESMSAIYQASSEDLFGYFPENMSFYNYLFLIVGYTLIFVFSYLQFKTQYIKFSLVTLVLIALGCYTSSYLIINNFDFIRVINTAKEMQEMLTH